MLLAAAVLGTLPRLVPAVPTPQDAFAQNYTKREVMIPMRDGIRLYTSIYTPKNPKGPSPIMLHRTGYSAGPYGEGMRSPSGSPKFVENGYTFVYQDVRGRYMSEGEFVNVRPLLRGKAGIDESTDTYDTIDWLVKNVPNNNGKVGIWGISYPGHYAAVGAVNSHPALKAASPQAPVTNWWVGDDFHHNGALFLQDAFNFLSGFGHKRPQPVTSYPPRLSPSYPDSYNFFLNLGPVANANALYFKDRIPFWNEIMANPDYNEFWKARDTRLGLIGVKSSVMVVGGWFDAENLWGALETYKAMRKNNPKVDAKLVMGPWFHGQWSRDNGRKLGDIDFGFETSVGYREEIEFPYFDHALRGGEKPDLATATVFETGTNQWRKFAQWPPAGTRPTKMHMGADGTLTLDRPTATQAFDQYVSDPAKPVPFTSEVRSNRNREYMIADQRFASRRPDVLVYATPPLKEDLTLAGPVVADLLVSTTGTDADFVVKLVDVFPDDLPSQGEVQMGGYQMLVRAEVMRGKYRSSMEKPTPFQPGKVTPVKFGLPDVMHTFKKGHRMMVQVQSSWFPLVDRNPQKFLDINKAKASDFQKATIRLHRSRTSPSGITVQVLPK